jgi:mycofactocin system transcriptional regulator
VDDIAEAVGIGRRTFFRYYSSKNDIPWGQFDASLAELAASLRSMPHDIPVHEAVHRAVVEFNRFEPEALTQHRRRMTLLLDTPALQAHSTLRYAQWRRTIAEYVAERYRESADDLRPRAVGYISLALALSAYEQWLRQESDRCLEGFLDEAMMHLRSYLA